LLFLYAPRFRLFVQRILLRLNSIRVVIILLRVTPAAYIVVFVVSVGFALLSLVV
jgi:hypothetical protein